MESRRGKTLSRRQLGGLSPLLSFCYFYRYTNVTACFLICQTAPNPKRSSTKSDAVLHSLSIALSNVDRILLHNDIRRSIDCIHIFTKKFPHKNGGTIEFIQLRSLWINLGSSSHYHEKAFHESIINHTAIVLITGSEYRFRSDNQQFDARGNAG